MEDYINVKCFSSRFAFERRFSAAALTAFQCYLFRSCAFKAAIVLSISSGFIEDLFNKRDENKKYTEGDKMYVLF